MSSERHVSCALVNIPLTLRHRSVQSYAAITEAMENGHADEPGVDADGDTDMAAAPRAGADGAAGSGEGSEDSGEGYREAEREPEGEEGLPDANGGFGGGVLGLAVPRQARTSKREPRQKQVRSRTPDSEAGHRRSATLQHTTECSVERKLPSIARSLLSTCLCSFACAAVTLRRCSAGCCIAKTFKFQNSRGSVAQALNPAAEAERPPPELSAPEPDAPDAPKLESVDAPKPEPMDAPKLDPVDAPKPEPADAEAAPAETPQPPEASARLVVLSSVRPQSCCFSSRAPSMTVPCCAWPPRCYAVVLSTVKVGGRMCGERRKRLSHTCVVTADAAWQLAWPFSVDSWFRLASL